MHAGGCRKYKTVTVRLFSTKYVSEHTKNMLVSEKASLGKMEVMPKALNGAEDHIPLRVNHSLCRYIQITLIGLRLNNA